MIIDKEDHKRFLLELMEQVSYPGRVLDLAWEVKQAVMQANVPASAAAIQREFDRAVDARDMPIGVGVPRDPYRGD